MSPPPAQQPSSASQMVAGHADWYAQTRPPGLDPNTPHAQSSPTQFPLPNTVAQSSNPMPSAPLQSPGTRPTGQSGPSQPLISTAQSPNRGQSSTSRAAQRHQLVAIQEAAQIPMQALYQTPPGSPSQLQQQAPIPPQSPNYLQPQSPQFTPGLPIPANQQLQIQIPTAVSTATASVRASAGVQQALAVHQPVPLTSMQGPSMMDRVSMLQNWAAAGLLGTASALVASIITPTTQRTFTTTSLQVIAPPQSIANQLVSTGTAIATTANSTRSHAGALSQTQTQTTTVRFASPLQQVLSGDVRNYMGQPGLNPNAPAFQSFWNSAFSPTAAQFSHQGQVGAPPMQSGSMTNQQPSPNAGSPTVGILRLPPLLQPPVTAPALMMPQSQQNQQFYQAPQTQSAIHHALNAY